MADMQSHGHPLQRLPAMLNLVLLETAKILRDPECYNNRQTGLTKRKMAQMVTGANQRFQDALDELEVDILRAKAVMERDLRLIQKEKTERDRANGLIRDPSPVKESNDTAVNDAKNPLVNMPVDQPHNEPESVEELSLAIETFSKPADLEPVQTSNDLPKDDLQNAVVSQQTMPQDSENSIGLAITMPPNDPASVIEEPTISENKPPEPPSLPETSMEITDAVDLDFESMFNDTGLTATDDPLNFDLEFSTDPAVTQDVLTNSNFDDLNMSNADLINLPPNTNEDIDSLLPGVEHYLNADIDISNLDIPQAALLPDVPQGTALNKPGAPTGAANDTSFGDDLFGFGDFGKGETGGDELGETTLGDFEDFDWGN